MTALAASGGGAAALENLLRAIAAEVRVRRAERGAWRGAFWGALAAVPVLAVKGMLGDAALAWALLVFGSGLFAFALAGASRRVPPVLAARLADRSLGLHDRVATVLECSACAPAGRLYGALLDDAVSRVRAIGKPGRGRFVPRTLPREARLLALPVLAGALLALAPPLPGPQAWLAQLRGEQAEERAQVSLMDRIRVFGNELLQRSAFKAQEGAPRAAEPGRGGAEPAVFKDRALAKKPQDFASFVNQGDERLRVLERTDRLPDLQSDFASSQYRAMLRKSRELSAGKGPNQVSAAKLAQILQEMERLGRRGGDWGDEAREGLEALERGETDEAMEAVEQALGKMRDAEEKQRSSKSLKGRREQAGQDDNAGSDPTGQRPDDAERRGGYSQSKGGPSKGNPSARLRTTPYDTGVQGSRSGRMPSYETQNMGRPGSLGMQLQHLGEIGQYRRLMEDAIAREQVPRDYHNQVRDYFKSLNEQ